MPQYRAKRDCQLAAGVIGRMVYYAGEVITVSEDEGARLDAQDWELLAPLGSGRALRNRMIEQALVLKGVELEREEQE